MFHSLYNLKAHIRLWLTAALGLFADLASKSWILSYLGNPEEQKSIVIIDGYFRFVTVFNRGAVAGVASGKTTFLIVISAFAVVFLLWLFATSRSEQWYMQISVGMLLAGALGNAYDRIFNQGQVVDFIEINLHFPPANPWPVFNIADILLCVGVGIILLFLIVQKRKAPAS